MLKVKSIAVDIDGWGYVLRVDSHQTEKRGGCYVEVYNVAEKDMPSGENARSFVASEVVIVDFEG